MAFSDVALGVASVVMGLHHLRKGAQRLRPLAGLGDSEQPVRVPGRPFANSGYKNVASPNGARMMRMRSFNIRNLDGRIAYLRRLVDEGKRDPEIYAFARRAIGQKCGKDWCVPEKDNFGEAVALFRAQRRAMPPRMTARDVERARGLFGGIRRGVRYTSDIAGVDTYQRPSHTVALGTADCDDYSTLTCAALGSIGIPCRFKVIRTKGAKDWNHIYAQAGFPRANPTRWVTMDGSVDMPFGWEAPPRMVADSRIFRVG